MLQFDLNAEPPTTRELVAVESELKQLRRNLVKKSCISDGTHALILIILYFGNFLSGPAIAVTVVLSLIVAILLATATRENLIFSDIIAIAAITAGVITAVTAILGVGMSQSWGGSVVAGVTAGSIVVSGTWLGRQIKTVMFAMEQHKPIPVDSDLQQELAQLCRQHPVLSEYRTRASQNLRPHLTFGELEAMRQWHKQQPSQQNDGIK